MKNCFYKLPTPLLITFFTIIGVSVLAAIGAIVMLLWNTLVPDIFGITTINFWQALGLLVLARLFFGGIGHHHSYKGKNDNHHDHNYFFKKWKEMTPEERKEFIWQRHNRHASNADCFQKEEKE